MTEQEAQDLVEAELRRVGAHWSPSELADYLRAHRAAYWLDTALAINGCPPVVVYADGFLVSRPKSTQGPALSVN